jgi:hypothetical protein
MNLQIREPVLHATPILDLHPTQMTVGMREVELKRQSWTERDPATLDAFLEAHMVPVIIGPGGDRYLIDHHHLSLALLKAGARSVFVTIVSDLRKLDPALFWNMMDYHGWTHPFDAKGRRRDYSDLPATIEGMKDDPYRSLAGELRNIGGFAKDSTPYSEFVWADYLRLHIKQKAIKANFEAALEAALTLAKSEDANYLPGWCAPRAKAGRKKQEKAGESQG